MLAALRLWQNMRFATVAAFPAHAQIPELLAISDGNFAFTPLSRNEIDVLCERLNCRPKIDDAEQKSERAEKFREVAARSGLVSGEDISVDKDAVVSFGDDPGAYVAAWIWVTNEEAGIKEEETP